MIDLFGRRKTDKLKREIDDANREIKRKDGIIERNCNLIKMYSEELSEALDENVRLKNLERIADRETIAKMFISNLNHPTDVWHATNAFAFADAWIAARDAPKPAASGADMPPAGCRECITNPGTIACAEMRGDLACDFAKRHAE